MGEVLRDNLDTVVILMAVILSILVIIIMYIMMRFRSLRLDREDEEESANNTAAITLFEETLPRKAKQKYADNDEEVVAAIVAAICAYSGMSADQFEIKSINIMNNSNSSWRRQNLIS